MREARKRNYKGKHCCCCSHPPKTFFERGENPPCKKFECLLRLSSILGKEKKPNAKKRGEGFIPHRQLTILPASSSPHLPNNERSLVPGASSSSSLVDNRLCKIYNEYEICKMQYAICKGRVLPDRLGLNQCFIDWKTPSPDPGSAIRCASTIN